MDPVALAESEKTLKKGKFKKKLDWKSQKIQKSKKKRKRKKKLLRKSMKAQQIRALARVIVQVIRSQKRERKLSKSIRANIFELNLILIN